MIPIRLCVVKLRGRWGICISLAPAPLEQRGRDGVCDQSRSYRLSAIEDNCVLALVRLSLVKRVIATDYAIR